MFLKMDLFIFSSIQAKLFASAQNTCHLASPLR